MIKRLWILVVALWPMEALAQSRFVQSGWHETFTRLVIPLPSNSEWNVNKTEDGYLVSVDEADALSLQRAFDLIPRERVSDIEVTDQGLNVVVSCVCFADAFLFQPTLLVLDVIEGEPDPDGPFELALNATSVAIRPELELPITMDIDGNELLEAVSPLSRLSRDRDDGVDAFAASVSQNLQRGIEQGLLNVNPDQPMDLVVAETRGENASPPNTAVTTFDDLPSLGLEASTSIDIDLNLGQLLDEEPQRQSCWPDGYVAVNDWAEGLGFNEDIAPLRQALFRDLERPSPSAFRDLARAYVYYGFGAEAKELINAAPEQSAELWAISELASLIDDVRFQSETLPSQVNCPGQVAVWALLVSEDDALDADADIDGIIAAFRALPDTLRAHLTPRMATRLSDVGEDDAALFLLEGRGDSPDLGGDLALAAAQIAQEGGAISEADAVLADAQSDLPEPEPELFAALVDLRIDQGVPIEKELVRDIETSLFTNRSGPKAGLLFTTLLDAQLYRDEFKQAIATIDRFSQSLPIDLIDDSERRALDAVVDRGSDLLFLEFAFADAIKTAMPQTQSLFAERLIALGFPQQALAVLHDSVEGPSMADRRVLRAKAHLAMSNADLARREIAGMTSTQALDLFRQIEASTSSSDDLQASLAALRDQQAPEPTTDALLDQAVRLLDDQTRLDPVSPTPLQDSSQLISQSEETRATVEGLLERFEAD